MRRIFVCLGLLAAMVLGGLATPALADSGVIKDVFIEDSQGTTLLADDPNLTECLGYEGQIFEDRYGVFNLTFHTRGAMAGALHVEADITASFVISPVEGTGVVYTGTYREHSAGNFVTVDDEDMPYPADSTFTHATGTGSDGSTIRFSGHEHSTIDKRTGAVRSDIAIGSCSVS